MALGHRCFNLVSVEKKKKEKAESEIMADVRGSGPPGYVSNRPKDTVSSTGAQICNVGNIMTVWFLVLWLETACRHELDLIIMVESVGSSGIHFKEVQKREREFQTIQIEMKIGP